MNANQWFLFLDEVYYGNIRILDLEPVMCSKSIF